MLIDPAPAPSRARLRARVAARLLSQAGDTMIEVTVAALLVALIAVATFTGYSAIAHVVGGQNTRAQATAIAEADQARLHGLTLDNLVGSTGATGATGPTGPVGAVGNTSYTETVDNTVYTVASSTAYVSGAGSPSCTSSGFSTADEVQTTSTVTWTGDAAAGGPVELHGLVTPSEGGALIVRVVNSSGNAVSGASVTLSGGPTYTSALTTDANGCVEFGGLAGGTYTAATTYGGGTSAVAPTVVPTQTSNITLTPGGDGSIAATFTTYYNGSSHASSADQIVAWNSLYPAVYNVFGSASSLGNNTYNTTVNSGATLGPGTYTVYPGQCAGDQSSGGSKSATVTTNTTTPVSLPLPAAIVNVYGPAGTVTDDPASSSVVYSGTWTHATGATNQYDNTDSYSGTAGSYVTFTFTGTSIQWIGPTAHNQGYANVLIDGTQVATDVNTYTPTQTFENVLFSATGLTNASHTIEIYIVGPSYEPPGSTGASADVDAFVVGTGASAEVDDAPSSSVVYTGGADWTHGATGSNNYDSTESFDQTAGDTVSFTFTGTSVEWIAPVSNNGGYTNVYIDGNLVASNVTTYSATTYYKQVIWSTAGLASGTHTLKLVAQATKPAASTGYYLQVDAFIYGTATPSLLTTAPLVTFTDNNTGCSGENYPATQVPTATQGALVDPGQPYGNFTVCASANDTENSATLANTSYTAGNSVNLYLAPGSSGQSAGSCT
jgi:hypothetical protein